MAWIANAGVIAFCLWYLLFIGDSRCILSRHDNRVIQLSVDHTPALGSEAQRVMRAGFSIAADNYTDQRTKKTRTYHCVVGSTGNKLLVTRALGDFEFKINARVPQEQAVTCIPDIQVHRIVPRSHFIVIACDGVFENMSNEEVAHFIRTRLTQLADKPLNVQAETAAKDLCTHVVTNLRGSDNTTAIVIIFGR